ncbi:hypothetical protein WCLP8_5190011 [uncultured Gammaproteobacteria bacterium]
MADIFVSDVMATRDKIEAVDEMVKHTAARSADVRGILHWLRCTMFGLAVMLPVEIIVNKQFIGNPHLSYIWLSIIILMYIARLLFWIWYSVVEFDHQTRQRELAQLEGKLAQFVQRTVVAVGQKSASGNLADKNTPNVFARIHAEDLNLRDELADDENFDQAFAEYKLALGGESLWLRVQRELAGLKLIELVEEDARRVLGKVEAEALLARVQKELAAAEAAEAAQKAPASSA